MTQNTRLHRNKLNYGDTIILIIKETVGAEQFFYVKQALQYVNGHAWLTVVSFSYII